jgi:hypothetical protein
MAAIEDTASPVVSCWESSLNSSVCPEDELPPPSSSVSTASSGNISKELYVSHDHEDSPARGVPPLEPIADDTKHVLAAFVPTFPPVHVRETDAADNSMITVDVSRLEVVPASRVIGETEKISIEMLSVPNEPPIVFARTNEEVTSTIHSPAVASDSADPGEHSHVRPIFEVGDHVYQWCSWGIVPGIAQRHGIVLEVRFDPHSPISSTDSGIGGDSPVSQVSTSVPVPADTISTALGKAGGTWILKIADFSLWEESAVPMDTTKHQRGRATFCGFQSSCVRVYQLHVDGDQCDEESSCKSSEVLRSAGRWQRVHYSAGFWCVQCAH